jgi:maleylacetate reductase
VSGSPAGHPFAYDRRAVRVRFGAGALADLRAELEGRGWRRAFVVTTPGRSARFASALDGLGEMLAGVFSNAEQHVPATTVTEGSTALAAAGADCCVALGGGSAIGLGKALARASGLPLAAVPTTYSGSEMTSIWGLTEGGEKRTGRDSRAAARLVLYDPELTYDLPATVSAESGLNAVAHAVEALYAPNLAPDTAACAEEAIRRLAGALPRVVREPRDVAARAEALMGAHLAGVALDQAAMGLHHRLCHVLGGMFGTPHARTHALLLPHVVAFNAPAASEAMRRVARALGADNAVSGLRALVRMLGISGSLSDLGIGPAEIARAADAAVGGDYPNPRPVTAADVRGILEAASRAA